MVREHRKEFPMKVLLQTLDRITHPIGFLLVSNPRPSRLGEFLGYESDHLLLSLHCLLDKDPPTARSDASTNKNHSSHGTSPAPSPASPEHHGNPCTAPTYLDWMVVIHDNMLGLCKGYHDALVNGAGEVP
jgi:hypothetical protein